MANLKASLLWHCKTDKGWQRLPVVFAKNNRIKLGVVLIDGKEQSYPDGAFHLRTYESRAMKYRNVGKNAAKALTELQREISLLKTRDEAKQLGATLVVDGNEQKKTLPFLRVEFLADKKKRKSRSAESLYRLTLDGFFQTCSKLVASEIVGEDLLRFVDYLKREGFAAKTIHTRYNALITFLTGVGVDKKKFPPKHDRPKEPKKVVEIYEDESELERLFANSSPRNGLLFEVLLKTGLREQEASTLEWWNLDLKQGVVKVCNKPEINFKIKDCEERSIPIPRALVEKLAAWKAQSGSRRFVFGTKKDTVDGHLLRSLRIEVREAGLNCEQCSLCASKGECKRWWLHKFRATFATTCLQRGMDPRTLMTLMGHSDIQTTMRYLAPAREDRVRASVEAIWGEPAENVVQMPAKRKRAS